MRFTARTRFAIAAAAAAAGFGLVVFYGWRALDEVSDESDRLRDVLKRLGRIERIEEEVHELAAGVEGARLATVDRLLADLRDDEMPADENVLYERFAEHVESARRNPSAQSWAVAADALSAIGRRAVEDATESLALASEPASSGGKDILRLGAAVTVVCAALAGAAALRLRRERADQEARLRRSDRLAALGTMAASVAHEINNPLATISGCATAVRDRLVRNASAHADEIEYLGMIVDETRRCTGIVRNLRDLARDRPPAMAPYDLRRLVDEVVGLVQMSREGPRVAWDVTGDESLEVVCDPDKVKQLVLNLFLNARDASPDGSPVRVTMHRVGDSARLVVEDRGCGIARDDLPRLFEPFHTSKTRGLGLGLFVCERVAALHGGTIAAESDGPGRGSRFTVTLPCEPAGAAGAAPAGA